MKLVRIAVAAFAVAVASGAVAALAARPFVHTLDAATSDHVRVE